MIVLLNINHNVELQLDIVGYQFPDISDNWCLLKVTVLHNHHLFEKVDPALEVPDLYKLYHWFNALAQGRLPTYAELNFTEPCLSLNFISYHDEIVRISITLNCEIMPDFALDDSTHLIKDWTLFFDLSKNTFELILKSIQQWIQDYPKRG